MQKGVAPSTENELPEQLKAACRGTSTTDTDEGDGDYIDETRQKRGIAA